MHFLKELGNERKAGGTFLIPFLSFWLEGKQPNEKMLLIYKIFLKTVCHAVLRDESPA